MGEILAAWMMVIFGFMIWNLWDAYMHFPSSVWREAELWRWCFAIGFLIVGPVSVIVGLVYRAHYRPRLVNKLLAAERSL